MSTFNEFNKSNLLTVRQKIDAALAKVAEELGLESLKMGSINFSSGEFKSQIVGAVRADGNPVVQLKNKSNSAMLGYSDSIIGEIFTVQGRDFKVTKIDANRPKFPIIADGVADGKSYKFAARYALNLKNKAITHDPSKNIFAHAY